MDRIHEMAETFKLLGDKTRLTILGLLRERSLCVCDIVELLGMSQPAISQHLRKLRSGGLVREERRGQWMYYHLAAENVPYVLEVLRHVPSLQEMLEKQICKTGACC
ncbi:ArsR/SmtB family transcription factor [Paenibacillus chartarius]|uniref:ArsR/SmtB family transcription factor n=1 Tax=Paenibacillus chartarius TaxID=747481 RepID=A0ABV6DR57_9BACL